MNLRARIAKLERGRHGGAQGAEIQALLRRPAEDLTTTELLAVLVPEEFGVALAAKLRLGVLRDPTRPLRTHGGLTTKEREWLAETEGRAERTVLLDEDAAAVLSAKVRLGMLMCPARAYSGLTTPELKERLSAR